MAISAPELISSIFFWAIEDTTDEEYKKTLMAISKICRLWRDVALNEPRLWTRFSFSYGNDLASPRGCTAATRLLSLWIERSKSATIIGCIEIYLLELDHNKKKAARAAEKIITMVFKEQYRWGMMHFNITGFTMDPGFSVNLTNCPRLTRLSFDTFLRDSSDDLRCNVSGFAPLGIPWTTFKLPKPIIGFPASPVAQGQALAPLLTILMVYFEQNELELCMAVASFLEHCPCLKTLIIEQKYLEGGLWTPLREDRSPIVLSQLKNLELGVDDHLPLLMRLIVPSLETLTLHFREESETPDMNFDFAEAMLLRSEPTPPLRVLTINLQSEFKGEDWYVSLLSLMEAVPTLEKLCFYYLHGIEMFWTGLAISNDSTIVCPNLRRITVTSDEVPDGFGLGSFINMAYTRSTLRPFTIAFDCVKDLENEKYICPIFEGLLVDMANITNAFTDCWQVRVKEKNNGYKKVIYLFDQSGREA
jgi:hypothetical protein